MMMRLALLVLLVVPAPCGDGEAVYGALDGYIADKDAAKARAALAKYAPAKLIEIIRAGRPVGPGRTGDSSFKIKDAFGTETDVFITVPKNYDPKKPAGVVLLLHGMGGDGKRIRDNRWYTAQAEKENYIIAAPTAQRLADNARAEDDPPNGDPLSWGIKPGGAALMALRELHRMYAIDDDRIILTGYSMGGFGTQRIGFRYPDRFCALVAYAGGLSYSEYAQQNGDPKLRPLVENGKGVPIYLCHGDKDQTVPVRFDRQTHEELKAFGAAHEYVEVPGAGHGLRVEELMKQIQPWLSGKRRAAHPKRVAFVSAGDYAASAWWVRIGDASPGARVTAEVKERNVIEVATAGASKLTLFIDETLHDLSKPVVVKSGGKELFNGKAEESVEAILESWSAREDRGLVYRAKISVSVK